MFASRRKLYDTGEICLLLEELYDTGKVHLFPEDYMILEKFVCFQKKDYMVLDNFFYKDLIRF